MYIGICEDEEIQLNYLQKHITTYCERAGEVLKMECFSGAEELLFKYEQDLPFDCLLLDIRMGKMDGMELAVKIRQRDRQLPIIFVTGDKDAVFDGYKVGAVRYLLKPIKDEELAEALDYVRQEYTGQSKVVEKEDYFCFNYAGEYTKIDKNAIITVEVQGHYITLHAEKEYTFKETMRGIREKLADERFVPASRSVLVNLEHVKSITRRSCRLSTGQVIPLSRSCYNDFNQAFIKRYV